MKTLLIKLQVLAFIFFCHFLVKAQNEELYPYRGGNADGFATEAIEDNTCPIPYHQVAYFGGIGDGAGQDALEENSCSTPFNQFAYFGGVADGATVETSDLLNCSTPFHFYAYFGGDADGASYGKTEDVCPIDPPVVNFTASETTTCVGRTVTFTDTSTNMPTGWLWTFEGGTPSTATTKTVNVVYQNPGSYQVTLEAANYVGSGTEIKAGYITVLADCTPLATVQPKKAKMLLYPNPTKNIVYIKSPETILSVEVYDMSGRKLMKAMPAQKETQLNLERLSAGMYLMKTRTAQGEDVNKVIKLE